jgi:murein DD-endopeptidase MepM/ murein hydrolase activator NlpD
MGKAMKRATLFGQIIPLLFCGLLILSSCARPDGGPSPFEALTEPTARPKPLPDSPVEGPAMPLIPDAELVFSPTTVEFEIEAEILARGGRLADYREEVGEETLTGAQIVERVAREYSVHPRLLLAVLRHTGGWVSGGNPAIYPIYGDQSIEMILFRQLSYLANTLNYGYYARRVGGLPAVTTLDGVEITLSKEVNDATAAVQFALAQLYGYYDWEAAVGPFGLQASYAAMFGDPFAHQLDALIPDGLTQPALVLPYAPGEGWFFTSGPHAGWGTGSAWAALDFAPDEEGWGCYQADAWVTAVADGPVVRIGDGIVVQDLDGDGEEGTGWTVLYMHIADAGKATLGQDLRAGDPIGHPSCAGGPATGSHLHLARRYNGEWIPADQDIPFNLSGWVSRGDGLEYDGTLTKGATAVEAAGFPTDENKITH